MKKYGIFLILVFLILLYIYFKDSEEIKVGIIDSGVSEYQMKDVHKYINYVSSESIKDELGHGTAITNIISNNSKRNIKFYIAKNIDKNGRSNKLNFSKSLRWMIDNKVKVINISQGIMQDDNKIHKLIKEAKKKDILIVCASGNNFLESTDYPAKYMETISIGTIDSTGKIHQNSGGGKIDYVALGVNISTKNKEKINEKFTGNSYATAFATATIIDLIETNNKVEDNIKILDKNTLNPYSSKKIYGKGVIINEKNN